MFQLRIHGFVHAIHSAHDVWSAEGLYVICGTFSMWISVLWIYDQERAAESFENLPPALISVWSCSCVSEYVLESINIEKYFPVEQNERFTKYIYLTRENRSNVPEINHTEIFVSIKIFLSSRIEIYWQNNVRNGVVTVMLHRICSDWSLRKILIFLDSVMWTKKSIWGETKLILRGSFRAYRCSCELHLLWDVFSGRRRERDRQFIIFSISGYSLRTHTCLKHLSLRKECENQLFFLTANKTSNETQIFRIIPWYAAWQHRSVSFVFFLWKGGSSTHNSIYIDVRIGRRRRWWGRCGSTQAPNRFRKQCWWKRHCKAKICARCTINASKTLAVACHLSFIHLSSLSLYHTHSIVLSCHYLFLFLSRSHPRFSDVFHMVI